MSEKKIHLPSGETLTECAVCGCAVLNMELHRASHATEYDEPEPIAPAKSREKPKK